jgi:hypothetical protein
MARRVRSDLPQNTRLAPSQAKPLTQPNDQPQPQPEETSVAHSR